jgi:hypothetical protein
MQIAAKQRNNNKVTGNNNNKAISLQGASAQLWTGNTFPVSASFDIPGRLTLRESHVL